jgi:hypothetical protein
MHTRIKLVLLVGFELEIMARSYPSMTDELFPDSHTFFDARFAVPRTPLRIVRAAIDRMMAVEMA